MPPLPRLAAALSLAAAMTLTGANVAFGKAIVAAVPVYLFVCFRLAVASAALLVIVRWEGGPRLAGMTACSGATSWRCRCSAWWASRC